MLSIAISLDHTGDVSITIKRWLFSSFQNISFVYLHESVLLEKIESTIKLKKTFLEVAI